MAVCCMARVQCRNLGFPVPNFNSFWVHLALSMDAKDFSAAVKFKGDQVLHLAPG
jgi:hypothetical protein